MHIETRGECATAIQRPGKVRIIRSRLRIVAATSELSLGGTRTPAECVVLGGSHRKFESSDRPTTIGRFGCDPPGDKTM